MQSRPIKHYYIARVAAAFILVIIFIGGIWGRAIQLRYPTLSEKVAELSLFLGLVTLLASYRYLTSLWNYFQPRIDRRNAKKYLCISLIFVVLGILYCELSVVLPIERIHFIKYSLLSFFLFFSAGRMAISKRLLFAIVTSALIGTLDESLQYWNPVRVYDVRDIQINIISAFFGGSYAICAYLGIKRSFRRHPL